MDIVDRTGKTKYTLGVGTEHARGLTLPGNSQGSMFDQWFVLLAGMQQLTETDSELQRHMHEQNRKMRSDEVRAKIMLHVIPVVNALWCLWTYTATDNAQLRSDLAQCKSEIAKMRQELDEMKKIVELLRMVPP